MLQRLPIAALALLVAGGLAWLLLGSGSEPLGGDLDGGAAGIERPDRSTPSDDGMLRGAGEGTTALRGDGDEGGPRRGNPPRRVTGLSRVPEGVDLTDPEEQRRMLRQLLAASPRNWQEIARVVGLVRGRLDEAVRQELLAELIHGDRVGAGTAFASVRDGSLVAELLASLDQPGNPPAARQAVLNALARMPGASAAEVVRGIEARLTGDETRDVPLLQAISKRGGREAARAVVEYILRSDRPDRVSTGALVNLDVSEDEEAAQIVLDAMRSVESAPALQALVQMTARPGADVFVEDLIALDQSGRPDGLRQQALSALATIGTRPALDHLLELSRQPGRYGEHALNALGNVRSADEGGREALMEALDRASEAAQPERTEASLLLALGTLRHEPAMPRFVEALDSPSEQVQRTAVQGLGNIGEAAAPHIDRLLTTYATSRNLAVQRDVIVALGGIGTDRARATLEQMRDDDTLDPALRRQVVVQLRRLERITGDDEVRRADVHHMSGGPR